MTSKGGPSAGAEDTADSLDVAGSSDGQKLFLLRPDHVRTPAYEKYNYDYPCSLGINHGGFFVGQSNYRSYCNGKTAWYDYVFSTKLTMSELERIVEDLGYETAGKLDVYWCLPGLQVSTGGLRKMISQ